MSLSVMSRMLVASLFFGASGCGGGGGGGGGSSGGVGSTSAFNTAEFQANFGLASINALTAYDNSATGAGVVVGVVDSGIDLTHADLVANINANSTFVTPITSSAQDIFGHGTNVAGIIAATKNSVGTHGVAFNSSILSIKVSDTALIADANSAVAIDGAVARSAKVINLSFGISRDAGVLALVGNALTLAAIQRAVNAGVVVVVAAGNGGADGIGDANTAVPAAGANCSTTVVCALGFDAKGLMIAVGAIDSNSSIASFSNRAGDTASAYMVAPGVNVVTTANGGGTATVNGTSFAAPHVTGAIALLLQRFPSLTGAQAVSILLASATDLGASGTDTIFGVGQLNLQTAFAAQGLASIPLTDRVSGNSALLISSQIKLGAAFGDAFSKQNFLGQAIILDAYDRAYRVDLRNRISNSSADLAVTSFLEQDQTKMVSAPMPQGLSLGFGVKESDEVGPKHEVASSSYSASLEKAMQDNIGTIRFSADLGRQSEFIAGLDASPLNLFTNSVAEEASGGVFFNSSWTSSPQLTLLGKGDSFMISHDIGSNTKFDIGMHHSSGFSSSSNSGAGHLLQMQLSHKSSSGFRYGLTTGYVSEEESLFSSSYSGAFGTMDDNRSEYATLAASWEINDKTIIFGTYTNATLKPSFSGDSLFDNWSRIHANSFAIGLTTQSQFNNGDRLGISLGQPLRVRKSTVDATLPVGRDLNGNIQQETQRVDLVPTGRQIDIQLAYSLRTRGQSEVTSFAALSLQPGHDSSASPEAAVGFKWRLEF